ncbi:MAG: LemA family protein [Candidatus Paceibacterota bacterium]|nr:MAG: LemA family protein [Candidatus Paceibacterota bacterium]
MMWLIIILAVVALWFALSYNGFVTLRNRVKEAWSDIDVQLKRRYDLIPNLVETVKGYAAHEQETFNRVIQARSQAMQAQSVAEHGAAENQLTGALKSLFALSEAYPQLRAVESFTKLQDELTDTEDKIQAARRFYNSTVMSLNTKVEQFPSNIIANLFSFKKEEFFEIEDAAQRETVKVQF